MQLVVEEVGSCERLRRKHGTYVSSFALWWWPPVLHGVVTLFVCHSLVVVVVGLPCRVVNTTWWLLPGCLEVNKSVKKSIRVVLLVCQFWLYQTVAVMLFDNTGSSNVGGLGWPGQAPVTECGILAFLAVFCIFEGTCESFM